MARTQLLWPELRDRLDTSRITDWRPLQDLYRAWAYPGSVGVQVDRTTVEAMLVFSAELLTDLARLGEGRPGFLRWLWQMADVREVVLPARPFPDFVTLYPFRVRSDWVRQYDEQRAAATELADRWAREQPKEVAARLAGWEAEANAAEGHVWPRWSPYVCQQIAATASDPGVWAEAFETAGLSGDLVGPFLARTVELGEHGWEARLTACLGRPVSERAGVAVVLCLPDPPSELWDAVWGRLPALADLVTVLCMTGQVSEGRVAALLGHPDAGVARAAAVGEWHTEPHGSVRPGLRVAWQAALARGTDEPPDGAWEYAPDLAHDWLLGRFQSRQGVLNLDFPPTCQVFDRLTVAERADLLAHVPVDAYWAGDAIRLLVGDDLDLYRRLIADDRFVRHHLAPLGNGLAAGWRGKAILALQAGYDPQQVAWATFRYPPFFYGDGSAICSTYVDGFTALEVDPDPLVAEVGAVGRAEAERRIADARREERREAVYGDD
jgi:hypothetical protein